MSKNPLAVQMYTLRDAVAKDIVGTLRAVAELGYGAVELHSLGGLTPAQLKPELDTLGLKVTGMHIALTRLENELDAAISDLKTFGATYAVCPWLPPERRGDAEMYRALARTLNQIGRGCRDQGLQLCYHNHDFEFQALGDTSGFEILFGETDPDLVKSELDLYWVAFAGKDPIAELQKLSGRVPLAHLKDMSTDGSRTFAEVGSGSLDFPAILAACDAAKVEWHIVEQDVCQRPPLESIGMSLAYLRSIGRA